MKVMLCHVVSCGQCGPREICPVMSCDQTCLFGQREICHVVSCGQCGPGEICHVMSCDQCEGHIYLFVWTGRYLNGKICYPLLI